MLVYRYLGLGCWSQADFESQLYSSYYVILGRVFNLSEIGLPMAVDFFIFVLCSHSDFFFFNNYSLSLLTHVTFFI